MKRFLKNTILVLFLQSSLGYSQTICTNGFAGVYPCNDYDLMAHIDLATFGVSSANDSWGWTDTTTGNEYALMGVRDGTVFVDITDPLNLVYLGKLPTATGNSSWRDIKVYQDHAFIVSEATGHGMQVFDLTKLRSVATPPTTFATDAYYTGFGSAHNIVINEDTGFAYAVGADFSGGAHFINIQNPTSPTAAGGYSGSGYTHDAQVVTYNGPDTEHVGKEIFFGSNEDEVVIVDVTNKTTPVLLGSLSYTGVEYTHQGWLTEDQRYFILGDELDEIRNGHNTRTYVFDFSDLDAPVYESTYESNNLAVDHNGYVLGNTYYLASYRAGLRILDISNINAINEIGYFDTYPENNGTSTTGAWNVYPYFASGNIVISDIQRGLFIVRQSNTLTVEEVSLSNEFIISPNPAFENSSIKSNNKQLIKSIELYNALGQKIFSKNNINKKEYVLQTNTYTNGIYLIKINASITKKLVLK